MINKLISLALFAFIAAISMTQLSAQAELKMNKIVIIEKEMDDDGKVVEKKVTLEGEEAEQYLKEHQDIGKMVEEETEIEMDGAKKAIAKSAYKIKIVNNDGEEEVIEWNGEGEMPAEIKEALEKEGIEIGSLIEGADEQTQSITLDDSGSTKKMKIITKGAGLEEVMDLDWEGEVLPDNVREILEQEGIALEEIVGADGEKQIKIVKAQKVAQPNPNGKPQLGVMIEAVAEGVKVSEVVPESSADEGGLKAGDIITSLDDKVVKTTQDLINAVQQYKPGDVVAVGFIRNNQPMKNEMKLKAYVDPFPFKTWEQVMNHGKTKEIQIEKEVIIKKEK